MTGETSWFDAAGADIAAHAAPAWRDRADFLLQVDLASHDMPGKWEQLRARRVGETRFELCCIPFFACGMTLGDVVEASEAPPHVTRVVRRSGRHLVRAAFLPDTPADRHEQLHGGLAALRIPCEWRGPFYMACSPVDEAELAAVLALIRPLEEAGLLRLEYDVG